MKYYDEHGNELHLRTELDEALDRLYDELDKLTPEERRSWYIKGMYCALPEKTDKKLRQKTE